MGNKVYQFNVVVMTTPDQTQDGVREYVKAAVARLIGGESRIVRVHIAEVVWEEEVRRA